MKAFRRLMVEAYVPKMTVGAITVSWVMERDFNSPGPYYFTLRRHANPLDDNPVAVAKGTDVYFLEDRSKLDRDPEINLSASYSVELKDGDGNVFVSHVITHDDGWNHKDWLLAREIVRKEVLLQKKKAGTKGWLLKRKWFGDACPTCLNPVTGESTKPHCPTCFGTGITGGYYPAQEYWVLMNATSRMQKLTSDQGMITVNDENVRGLAYPVIEPNDIWVNAQTGDRMRVMENVAAIARHRGVDIVVNAKVSALPNSSVAYDIPLNPL